MRIFLPWTTHRSSSTVWILWPIQLLVHLSPKQEKGAAEVLAARRRRMYSPSCKEAMLWMVPYTSLPKKTTPIRATPRTGCGRRPPRQQCRRVRRRVP